jgi:hypothetical protein
LLCNVVPGGAAGAAPATIRRGPATGLARDACGGARVARDWFRSDLRSEMAGGEVSGGARRRQPLRAQSRRGGQRGGAARKGGSTSEC